MAPDPTNPISVIPLGSPALTEVVNQIPGLKAGWKTTEFWLTIALLAAGAFMAYKGNDTMATTLWISTGVSYKATRTIQKIAHGKSIVEAMKDDESAP